MISIKYRFRTEINLEKKNAMNQKDDKYDLVENLSKFSNQIQVDISPLSNKTTQRKVKDEEQIDFSKDHDLALEKNELPGSVDFIIEPEAQPISFQAK